MDELKQLFEAISHRETSPVREAVERDPALVQAADENGKTLLHMAAEKNAVDLVAFLLSRGSDIARETNWGMTPLEWAANMDSAAVVDFLLEQGARMNLRSAAAVGKLEAVRGFWTAPRVLRPGCGQKTYSHEEDGAYVSKAPPEDYASIVSDAFYVAARNGHTDVVRWLLEQGADLHYKGTLGGTALHWAAGNGHRDTVVFLLEHGAERDKHVLDEEFEQTPAGWARHFGQTAIAELLDPPPPATTSERC